MEQWWNGTDWGSRFTGRKDYRANVDGERMSMDQSWNGTEREIVILGEIIL